MKKLLIGVLTAIIMAAGLVGVSSNGAATAADCPYSSCIKTGVSFKFGQVKKTVNRPVVVKTKVKAKNSNATPVGTIKVTVKRQKGGYTFSRSGPAPKFRVSTPKLQKPGVYKITVAYKRKAGTAFQNRTRFKYVTLTKR